MNRKKEQVGKRPKFRGDYLPRVKGANPLDELSHEGAFENFIEAMIPYVSVSFGLFFRELEEWQKMVDRAEQESGDEFVAFALENKATNQLIIVNSFIEFFQVKHDIQPTNRVSLRLNTVTCKGAQPKLIINPEQATQIESISQAPFPPKDSQIKNLAVLNVTDEEGEIVDQIKVPILIAPVSFQNNDMVGISQPVAELVEEQRKAKGKSALFLELIDVITDLENSEF